uniref:Uncharacterized protein n=1 Tax=Tanacetum cinerariifolium TaxID=118510 RepID=A0A699ITI9_TANCI|nr:hypothetical protein [Tanacetum cinerariifolium]
MKAHPKHIDWGKVIATNEIMDGYVMPKYENKNFLKDDSWIDIIMDDVYDTFYKDEEKEEEEEANDAKESEDMKLSIMKDDKGKGKLVEDNEKGKEAEHHHLKGKRKLVEDNGKGNVHDIQNRVGYVEVDLARAIKEKQVDDHDDDALDSLDLENKIKKLEEDFGKESKGAELAKQAKKTKEVELKENEAELKAKKANKAKEAMLAELKAKKAKSANEAMLAEVVQISSDKDDNEDPTALTFTRSKALNASTSTRSRAPTASTSTRSRAPIASTSNAQAASTAPRG